MDGGLAVNKRAGVLYEYEFFTRALRNNLEVFTPAGDHLPIDCMVVNGAGRVFRVQVKGTGSGHQHMRKAKRFKVTAATGREQKTRIDCTKVDILAVYIEPHDLFYIIPCLELDCIGPWFYPETENSRGKYETYKENWEPFKANS